MKRQRVLALASDSLHYVMLLSAVNSFVSSSICGLCTVPKTARHTALLLEDVECEIELNPYETTSFDEVTEAFRAQLDAERHAVRRARTMRLEKCAMVDSRTIQVIVSFSTSFTSA